MCTSSKVERPDFCPYFMVFVQIRQLMLRPISSWCPCIQPSALLPYGGFSLSQVYEHNSRDAIIASGVRSFPTFHFYLGGAKVDECRGANIAKVEQKANQHQAAARCGHV